MIVLSFCLFFPNFYRCRYHTKMVKDALNFENNKNNKLYWEFYKALKLERMCKKMWMVNDEAKNLREQSPIFVSMQALSRLLEKNH